MRLKREQALIGSRWLDADGGATFEVFDPASGAALGTAPRMGRVEAARAIDAAHMAQIDWRSRAGKERARVLRDWYDRIVADREDLAILLTAEQGKPLHEAREEIAYAADYVEWFAEEAKRVYGDVIPAHQRDKRILVLKQPVGVVAAITPWNFPAAMVTRKVAPALAAGCAVVLKPASQTPFTALALAALAVKAGAPAGLFNVVTGDALEIGAELTQNPRVRKLSFTGSTATGKKVIAACASTVKRLSLELGGNAPFVVFADADIDAAVEGALQSKFRNAGQTCVCSNRLLVHTEVYERFCTQLTERVAALHVGPGMEAGVDIGPLIDTGAVAKVEEHVADALARGARLTTGGERLGPTFYRPTVLRDARDDMLIAREETFGPVAPLFRFGSDDEAVALANATEFGLASYLYTRDAARLLRVAEALEYGIVGANTGLISTEVAPFGGMKESGFGREGSKYGIEDYLDIKYVCVGGVA